VEIYDVIIVGAGPAGLSCAISLQGLKVLLIEKKRIPYERIACGEWVPLNFDADTIVKTESMRTIYPGGEVLSPFKGKIIDRNRWQKKMLEELHCEIHLGERVLGVKKNFVWTDRNEYKCDWIVGADGPDSVVRKYVGGNMEFLPALNIKFETCQKIEETIVYFCKDIFFGYGWCFPRGDMVNVGIGMIGDMRRPLNNWIEFLKNRGIIKDKIYQYAGGLIPISGIQRIIKDNVILIGDAGGFVDPLTGAGIIYAYDTGRYASELIKGNIDIFSFEKMIKKIYGNFLSRRLKRRKFMEENWNDLVKAVENSWIAFIRE